MKSFPKKAYENASASFEQAYFSRKPTNLTNFVALVHTRKHNSLCHNLERRKTDTCLQQQSSRDAKFFLVEFRFSTSFLPVMEQPNLELQKEEKPLSHSNLSERT